MARLSTESVKRDEVERKEDINLAGSLKATPVITNESIPTADGDKHRTLWQNVKKYRKVVLYTFSLTSAILLYGYDNVVVGTVSGMPPFQEDFGTFRDNEWILPATWLAVWNLSSPLGAMVGSLFGGWLQDRVGRRYSLAISSFLSSIAVAVMFVSYIPSNINGRRACFLVGKLFQGGSIGAVMAATQTYLSEVLPAQLRGSGMALFPVFTLLGQLTGALVIFGSLHKKRGYVTAFGSQWPFSVLPIIIAFLIPESPTWLVRKKMLDKALRAQSRLDPPGTDAQTVIDKIAANIAHEELSAKASFGECFSKENRRRTWIVFWANTLTAVFGLPLLSKASYFLQIVGMKANLSIIFLIMGIILGLLANVASVWIVAKVGRRRLILVTLGITSLLWASMGVANCFHRKAVVWWTAVSMMLTIIVCGTGVWPSSFSVAAETSSLHLRGKTQGLGWFVASFTNAVSGIVLPYVFNPDAGNLRGKVGFTYAAACLLGVLVSWWCVPEMKGRTVSEIDTMFELRLPARAFKGWRDDAEQEIAAA